MFPCEKWKRPRKQFLKGVEVEPKRIASLIHLG